jgi:hypothetical protein
VQSRTSGESLGKRTAVSAAAGSAVAARANTKLALVKKQKLHKQEQGEVSRSNIKSALAHKQKIRQREAEDAVDEESVSDGIKGADELAQETLRAALSQRVAVCCRYISLHTF